ncbi:MAG: ABC transporter substrate-binding protein, partial [Polyangiaceae bacterium]
RFGQNFPLKVVAWDHVDGSALTVASSVSKLTDLAGKNVAVPFWYSIHNVILQQLLAKAGLTPILKGEPSAAAREVKLVVMAPPDMPPALANGAIAGFIVADPFNAISELNGAKVLRFTGDVWQQHACCVVVMHQDTIEQKPEWAQKVVTALARAQLYSRDNRAATAELLSKEGNGYLPQPKPAILRALTHYDRAEYGKTGAIAHQDWQGERIDFAPFPFPSYTEKLVQLLKETKVEGDTSFLSKLDPASVHAQLVDDRFARAAIQAVGGPARFGLDPSLGRDERFAP